MVRFFVMEYRDYLGCGYPYQYSGGNSAVPYVMSPHQRPPVRWLILQQLRLGHAAAVAAVLPAVLQLKLALPLISLPQDQLRLVNHSWLNSLQ